MDACQNKPKRNSGGRARRTSLPIPIRVRATNTAGIAFEEVTRSIDISATGTLFLLRQVVTKGMSLEVTMPLPHCLQKVATPRPVYATLAVVTRVEQNPEGGQVLVAVSFGDIEGKPQEAQKATGPG